MFCDSLVINKTRFPKPTECMIQECLLSTTYVLRWNGISLYLVYEKQGI